MNIAAVLRYVDMQRGEVWDDRYYITNDYMLMAKKYGIGMTAIMSEQAIEDVCRHCDGLIIQGSATDIDPKYYGGAPLPVPPVVDEYYLDSRLIKYFYEAGKPIFGICGGEQALNVYFGGTIARMPDPHNHYLEHPLANHPINIVEGSFVHDVFGTERAEINSFHNWWTDKVAPDLKVVATSDDGIVEALEWKEKNIFATQWHPEQSFRRGNPIEQKFFENFLKKCEECR
jgi:putative glutamine amidotransferase